MSVLAQNKTHNDLQLNMNTQHKHECCFCLCTTAPDEAIQSIGDDGGFTTTNKYDTKTPLPSDLIPFPCGVCKSYVHRHCLERCIIHTFENAESSIAVMKRPDKSHTVCSLCKVCQCVYEYRSDQATEQCANVISEEFKKNEHPRVCEHWTYHILVFIMQKSYDAILHLEPSTQQKLIQFVRRTANAVETLDTLTIQNYIYKIISAFSTGMCVWSGTGVVALGVSVTWVLKTLIW